MPLILTITPLGAQGRAADRQIRTLAQGSMSIGRAPGNDWVLADPDQHLSRTHCMVAFEGGRYVMTDLSTNGMQVNGAREPTQRNSRTVLTDGDSVRLGGYMLEVAEADGPTNGMASSPFGAQNFVTPGQSDPFTGRGASDDPLSADPLEDPISHGFSQGGGTPAFSHPMPHHPPALRVEDPFDVAENARDRRPNPEDDLFRGRDAHDAFTGPAQSQQGDIRSHAYTAPKPLTARPPTSAGLGDIDFDALIGDVSPIAAPHPLDPPAPQAVPARPPMTDFDDLLGDLPLSPVVPSTPPVAGPQAATQPLSPAAPSASPDPFSLPDMASVTSVAGMAPPIVAVIASPVAHPLPAVTGLTQETPTAGLPSPAGVGSPSGAASAAPALLAAFLEGAGMTRLDLSDEDPQAAMRAVGALFAAFVAGTREVLMSRAEIKSEMRVERTMLRARDNNALKFSVSPEEAMAALLHPRAGYKAPLAAVEEAFRDIRSHEMAVMAGLQTALIALLKRFDPTGLEGRLQKGGMFDAILPGAKRARFWELFCTTYNDLAREAEDDFHSVFGREFAAAYAAQIGKL